MSKTRSLRENWGCVGLVAGSKGQEAFERVLVFLVSNPILLWIYGIAPYAYNEETQVFDQPTIAADLLGMTSEASEKA